MQEKSKRFSVMRIKRYVALLAIVWTVVMFGIFLWRVEQIRSHTMELALSEARAAFDRDQAFRFWATTHGGVYVPIDEDTPPNPYLAHIPDRDFVAPCGADFTLMNPAYIIRQLNEEFTGLYGPMGHITSLKPLRPENAPDAWEENALMLFEQGGLEVSELTDIDGVPFFRFMQPMVTQEGCLKCHAHQGYQVGDIRGGVSVSLSMTALFESQEQKIYVNIWQHLLIWSFGLIVLLLGSKQVVKAEQTRSLALIELYRSEEKIRSIFEAMDDPVFVLDEENRFLSVNSPPNKLYLPPDEFLGKTHADVMPASTNEQFSAFLPLLKQGKVVSYEYSLDMRGETRWYATKLSPLIEDDEYKGSVAVVQDITDRKEAERIMEQSNLELGEQVEESTENFSKTIRAVAGREVRMAELKEVISKLRTQLEEAGQVPVADDPLAKYRS